MISITINWENIRLAITARYTYQRSKINAHTASFVSLSNESSIAPAVFPYSSLAMTSWFMGLFHSLITTLRMSAPKQLSRYFSNLTCLIFEFNSIENVWMKENERVNPLPIRRLSKNLPCNPGLLYTYFFGGEDREMVEKGARKTIWSCVHAP